MQLLLKTLMHFLASLRKTKIRWWCQHEPTGNQILHSLHLPQNLSNQSDVRTLRTNFIKCTAQMFTFGNDLLVAIPMVHTPKLKHPCLSLVFTNDASISASNIRRRITLWLSVSFVPTKGTGNEYATEFAYTACAYACVARENQALRTRTELTTYFHSAEMQ